MRKELKEYQSIKAFIKSLSLRYSENIAYRYLKEDVIYDISYFKFTNKINSIAAYFQRKEVMRTPIALIGKTSYEWVSTYFGILMSNNIVVSMDPNLLLEEKESILNTVSVKYVFADKQYLKENEHILAHCKTVQNIYDLSEFVRSLKGTDSLVDIEVAQNDVAQYNFTSGTTGSKKAVMLSYQNIISQTTYETVQPYNYDETVLSVLPIHHCLELTFGQLIVLEHGGTICINDGFENIRENIRLFQPTAMCVVPAILEEISRMLHEWRKEGNLTNKIVLKKILCGGAKLRPELSKELESFGIRVMNGFGMTEFCGCITINPQNINKPDSVGIPFRKDICIKIADDGELLINGPNKMIGYYQMDNRSYLTEDGFVKSGDLAKIDEEGYLYITGRKKNVIILNNGENVYPEELESCLSSIPKVKQVLVFEWNTQITAMIYTKDIHNVESIEQEVQKMNQKAATYKRITKIFYRDIPFACTSSGKIKRNTFLEEFSQHEKAEYVAPKTDTEKMLVRVMKEVLDLQKISILDNFFDLGGNSLLVLSVAAKTNITAQSIYEFPVIKDLAHEMEKETANNDIQINNQLHKNSINHFILENQNIPCKKQLEHVLLTGATGFLGAHILKELVNNKTPRITCLVRSKEKLARVYRQYFKEELPSNVDAILGDITKEKLGLKNSEYKMLLAPIDGVVHAAANVHHVGSREKFMKTNFYGTETVINFCKEADAVLHYISSYVSSGIGVVPIDSKQKSFDETILYIGQAYENNVYVHTKYLSEEKILEERVNGLQANIYRVGSLTSRRDGVFQINGKDNGLRNRIAGLLKLGIYTDKMNQFPIDFTPVDECAEAIVKLMYAGKANCIYHMFHPDVVRLKDFSKISRTGLKKVSKEEFMKTAQSQLEDKEISEYVFYNTMALSSKPIPMDCTKTVTALKALSFQWKENKMDYIRDFIF